jgi:anthraniloyl-CoA monooxygenase
MKRRFPALEVTVVERNRPYDTFGWGVVFSDQTLVNLRRADPETAQAMQDAFNHWDDIEVFYKGASVRSGGHGFIGIGRKRLLNILQERCEALGVKLVFETDVTDDQALAAAVQRRPGHRQRRPEQPHPHALREHLPARHRHPAVPLRLAGHEEDLRCLHLRLRTDRARLVPGPRVQVRRRHLDLHRRDAGAGVEGARLEDMSQEEGIAFCEKLFAKYLDGNALISNAKHLRGSANWIRFPRVICRTWVHWQNIAGNKTPIVLMGDAAHTAHFSIGSGTKLALEDAIDLADEFTNNAGSRHGHRAAGLRNAPQCRGAQDPERRAQLHRMVRARGPLHRHGDRAVRLLAAHAQPAHQPREPAAARCEVAGGL